MANNSVLQAYDEFSEEAEIAQMKKAQKKSRRRESAFGMALIAPYIVIFIIFSFIPVILGIAFSFMSYNPYDTSGIEFVGFQNYINLFNFDLPISQSFWSSFGTMFVYVAVGVPLAIIIPFFLAYFINMEPPGYKFFRALIYFPNVVSISIMGIIFGNMFAGDSSGLINSWFGTNIPWLSGEPWKDDTLRWVVIFIATEWWCTGSNFLIFAAAFKNVPKSLYEACEMDGGGKWKKILHVTIPNIKSTVNVCIFNILIGYLGLYGQVIVLNDFTNADIMVSPTMFLQHYLSDFSYARITGFICACAIIFGFVVMFFSTIQKVSMDDRKKKPKYTAACSAYLENKKILTSEVRDD